MSAVEFLQSNNLTALTGMLRVTQEIQGYGVLETIPAFYFLWWSHPAAVAKILQAEVAGTHSTDIFKNGFQPIWQAIAKAHRNTVKTILNANVTRVSRGLKTGTRPSVTYTKGDDRVTLDCEHIVMAVDLSLYASVVDDLTHNEKTLFTTSYTASTFITTLFESKATAAEASGLIWHYRIIQGSRIIIVVVCDYIQNTFKGDATANPRRVLLTLDIPDLPRHQLVRKTGEMNGRVVRTPALSMPANLKSDQSDAVAAH
ncbi:Aste57867_3910 [Aphanomyces stellatus]|uniref:Aste57867_3910 protein n=1 Tax=Aphanomyces stellatus TaxID=120398 RepID=A0A485KAK3_9STRA|nr:hypothetical protein As57867_003899 [Aphanomyces stellatus]VFT81049.1 Aste57867_3910 [Aphanomyces stellatus]